MWASLGLKATGKWRYAHFWEFSTDKVPIGIIISQLTSDDI
jgi:hypothetical protein